MFLPEQEWAGGDPESPRMSKNIISMENSPRLDFYPSPSPTQLGLRGQLVMDLSSEPRQSVGYF